MSSWHERVAREALIDGAKLARIGRSVAEAGLSGLPEPELLRAFCLDLNGASLPVARAMVMIDTLHPIHEGHVFRWRSDQAEAPPGKEYGRVSEGGDAAEKWKASPFHHLLETGGSVLRRRIGPEDALDFPVLDDLRLEGRRTISHSSIASRPTARSARWTASTRPGRPTRRAASRRGSSRRSEARALARARH